jgi:ABC-2 type transport system permease protein
MMRIRAVAKKEFNHIVRDPASLAIVMLMPVIMLIIYGYALNFDLKTIQTGVIDYCQSQQSHDLIRRFSGNRTYQLQDLTLTQANPVATGELLLKKGLLKQYLIIPKDFARQLTGPKPAEVSFVIDGADANVANLVYQYNEQILNHFLTDAFRMKDMIRVHTVMYFNPEAKSTFFFIPGLIAVILIMISALLTSLSIAREKESGSIDLIFISPLKSAEIIIGKTFPYIFVSLVLEIIILLFAGFWFQIPLRGDILVLFIFSLIYIITGLSFGILISTVSPSQKTAMFAALLGTLLPSIMLSGFIFPLESLHVVLRGISHLVPATYFLKIIRGVVLKGAQVRHFLFEGGAMIALSSVLLLLAMIKFSLNRHKKK